MLLRCLFFTAGRLKWTQRLSSLQLPAGLTGRRSSRTPTCSACTWTQKRIPGSSQSLRQTPLNTEQQTNPGKLWKIKRLFLQVFLYCCHRLLSLTLCCYIYFAPLFPAWPFAEAQANCALWDVIVSCFTVAAPWPTPVSPVDSLFMVLSHHQ